MKQGAIAMVDVLGFKGIWKEHKAEEVCKRLKDAAELFRLADQMQSGKAVDSGLPIRSQSMTLSDTFILSVNCPIKGLSTMPMPARKAIDMLCLALLARQASMLQRWLWISKIRLNIRGAISIGRFLLDPPLLIGPAVDEAANLMETPDGAFIWLSGEAEKLVQEFESGSWATDLSSEISGHEKVEEILISFMKSLIKYDVPLRDGRRLPAICVNPFIDLTKSAAGLKMEDALACFNSQEIGVRVKSANTEQFFKYCCEQIVEETSADE